MADYDNTNRGILGRNDKRENDKQPEFTGNINIEGVDYWLNGWVKERKDGSGKFFSLSVKPKEQRGGNFAAKPKKNLSEQLDDNIPF
jgi:hypothetical protein